MSSNATRTPKVSVVIPVYNNEKFLPECIESVLNQTLADIEIIVVNDGSKDNSIDVINDYAARDSRIVVIDRENKGVGASINEGFKCATGEYLAELDSDDYYELTMLETLYAVAEKEHSDITKSDCMNFSGSVKTGDLTEQYLNCADSAHYNKVVTAEDTKIFTFFNMIWTSLYRREFIIDNEIFWNEDVPAYNDNGFYFQTMVLAKSIVYVNTLGVHYRKDNSNSTIANFDKLYTSLVKEYDFIEKKLTDKNIYAEYASQLLIRKFWNFQYAIDLISFDNKLKFTIYMSDILKDDLGKNKYSRKDFPDNYVLSRANKLAYSPNEFFSEYIENKYKFSVIVAVYNAEKYLDDAINDLLNQTLKDFELIFVDDCSTDSSVDIISKYRKSDNRISIIQQEKNLGPAVARNVGLRVAHGKYIVFLDADDKYDVDLLQDSYTKINGVNADILVYRSKSFNNISNDTTNLDFAWGDGGKKFPEKAVFSFNEVKGNPFFAFNGWAWDKIFKHSYILENNIEFVPGYVGEDGTFVYKALVNCEKITVLDKFLYNYRVNTDTNSLSLYKKNLDEQYKMLLNTYEDALAVSEKFAKDWSLKSLEHLLWAFETASNSEETNAILFDLYLSESFEKLGILKLNLKDFSEDEDLYIKVKLMLMYAPGEYEKFVEDLKTNPLIKENDRFTSTPFSTASSMNGKIVFTQNYEAGAVPIFKISLQEVRYSNFVAVIDFLLLPNYDSAVLDTLYLSFVYEEENSFYSLRLIQAEWNYAVAALVEHIYYSTNNNVITFYVKYISPYSALNYTVKYLNSREPKHHSVGFKRIIDGAVTSCFSALPKNAKKASTSYLKELLGTESFSCYKRIVFFANYDSDTKGVPLFSIKLKKIIYNNYLTTIDFISLPNNVDNDIPNLFDELTLTAHINNELALVVTRFDWKKDYDVFRNGIYYVIDDDTVTVCAKYIGQYSGFAFRKSAFITRELYKDVSFKFESPEIIYENDLMPVSTNAIYAKKTNVVKKISSEVDKTDYQQLIVAIKKEFEEHKKSTEQLVSELNNRVIELEITINELSEK